MSDEDNGEHDSVDTTASAAGAQRTRIDGIRRQMADLKRRLQEAGAR